MKQATKWIAYVATVALRQRKKQQSVELAKIQGARCVLHSANAARTFFRIVMLVGIAFGAVGSALIVFLLGLFFLLFQFGMPTIWAGALACIATGLLGFLLPVATILYVSSDEQVMKALLNNKKIGSFLQETLDRAEQAQPENTNR